MWFGKRQSSAQPPRKPCVEDTGRVGRPIRAMTKKTSFLPILPHKGLSSRKHVFYVSRRKVGCEENDKLAYPQSWSLLLALQEEELG